MHFVNYKSANLFYGYANNQEWCVCAMASLKIKKYMYTDWFMVLAIYEAEVCKFFDIPKKNETLVVK